MKNKIFVGLSILGITVIGLTSCGSKDNDLLHTESVIDQIISKKDNSIYELCTVEVIRDLNVSNKEIKEIGFLVNFEDLDKVQEGNLVFVPLNNEDKVVVNGEKAMIEVYCYDGLESDDIIAVGSAWFLNIYRKIN